MSARPCPRPATTATTTTIPAPAKPAAPGLSKREREIRDRGLYLKNFWYAAALSQDLKPGKTKKVEMMGRAITLFRDEDGEVRAPSWHARRGWTRGSQQQALLHSIEGFLLRFALTARILQAHMLCLSARRT